MPMYSASQGFTDKCIYSEEYGVTETLYVNAVDEHEVLTYLTSLSEKVNHPKMKWYIHEMSQNQTDQVPDPDEILVVDLNDDDCYFWMDSHREIGEGRCLVFVHDITAGTFYGAHREMKVLPIRYSGWGVRYSNSWVSEPEKVRESGYTEDNDFNYPAPDTDDYQLHPIDGIADTDDVRVRALSIDDPDVIVAWCRHLDDAKKIQARVQAYLDATPKMDHAALTAV